MKWILVFIGSISWLFIFSRQCGCDLWVGILLFCCMWLDLWFRWLVKVIFLLRYLYFYIYWQLVILMVIFVFCVLQNLIRLVVVGYVIIIRMIIGIIVQMILVLVLWLNWVVIVFLDLWNLKMVQNIVLKISILIMVQIYSENRLDFYVNCEFWVIFLFMFNCYGLGLVVWVNVIVGVSSVVLYMFDVLNVLFYFLYCFIVQIFSVVGCSYCWL